MDPNAFYKLNPPYDSQSLATLPEDQKRVPVPYIKTDDSFVPMDTKCIGLIPASKFLGIVPVTRFVWAAKPHIGKQFEHPFTKIVRFGS
jgi:hypothetical protein